MLQSFETTNRRNNAQNDAQDRARFATGATAREARNLADPRPYPTDPTLAPSIERADPYELLFRSVNPNGPATGNSQNVQRVRYCLAAGTNRLWRQTQTWNGQSAPPTATACPHTSYGSQAVAVESITNQSGSPGEPVFSYDADPQSWSSDTERRENITTVHTDLRVDSDETQLPGATRLESGVFLRNSNRTPTASFTSLLTASEHRVSLNGSGSSDPDGETLSYTWTATGSGGLGALELIRDPRTITTPTPVESSAYPATVNFCLTVTDSRELDSEPACQAVSSRHDRAPGQGGGVGRGHGDRGPRSDHPDRTRHARPGRRADPVKPAERIRVELQPERGGPERPGVPARGAGRAPRPPPIRSRARRAATVTRGARTRRA
ncbi:MAG: hypothetical protein WKF31_00400 [Thermoleophilaceae bacterium]